ncbi:FG-GAP repeat domain-containing protein [Streptomyces sp. NPDC093225]|uniref:FG-GAP repeat domain-containing protein n=1 Tax=Streptomyces sp. NPDC093225 TaxID=3366034 RepID=UPI0037FD8BF0
MTGDGRADLVARDRSGVLWLYEATGSSSRPFVGKVKVGGGWNAYASIIRGNDLTGDGKADLVARDGAGVLWLYPGTGKAAAPFLKRVRVDGGWKSYAAVVGVGDVNGDGRMDLVTKTGTSRHTLVLKAGTQRTGDLFEPSKVLGAGAAGFDLLF